MAAAHLEFWFDFASTYSYLTAMRIEQHCLKNKTPLVWRPFLLGPIFKQQGWNTSPFVVFPAEGNYMWKELERHAKRDGLTNYKKPQIFPKNGLLAARISVAASNESWLGKFIREVFRANFEEDLDIADAHVIQSILAKLGVTSDKWLELAKADSTKEALRKQTEKAQALGIFGAPSFIVKDELFWGDDRLVEACDFASEK